MKTFKNSFPFLLILFISIASFGQKKSETFAVSGNCGMCKAKIEKAAKAAGAEYAVWNVESKKIEVKYNAKKTSVEKIQNEIAAVGYDNAGAKASDEVYQKLPACCHYEKEATTDAACCDMENCGKEKDSCKDMNCCKGGKCEKGDKGSKEEKGEKDQAAAMDCCKNGKCEKHSK